MPLKTYEPRTPSRRLFTTADFSGLTKKEPEKSLIKRLQKYTGRNNYGRICVRHRGGGVKFKYRIVDFKRDKDNISGVVSAIEYDPNRSVRIALITYKDGEKRYILCPLELKVGSTVMSGPSSEIQVGNCLPLSKIPFGAFIHNIEMKVGKGGQMVRTAGGYAQLLARDNGYAQLRLPSGEMRIVPENCRATIGQLGNIDHENIEIGKAGRTRWMGWRPRVRAVAMNPVDHPMGGGQGKTKGGRHPCSFNGQLAKGLKTRTNRATDKYILKRR